MFRNEALNILKISIKYDWVTLICVPVNAGLKQHVKHSSAKFSGTKTEKKLQLVEWYFAVFSFFSRVRSLSICASAGHNLNYTPWLFFSHHVSQKRKTPNIKNEMTGTQSNATCWCWETVLLWRRRHPGLRVALGARVLRSWRLISCWEMENHPSRSGGVTEFRVDACYSVGTRSPFPADLTFSGEMYSCLHLSKKSFSDRNLSLSVP